MIGTRGKRRGEGIAKIAEVAWEVTKLFRGVEAGRGGPCIVVSQAGNEQQIFLRQSAVDSACGPNSVFMALMALGLFPRRQLVDSDVVQAAAVAEMQRRARKYHFRGIGPRGMRDIVQPVARRIEWHLLNGVDQDIAGHTLQQLGHGRLVVLGVENPRRSFYHWVLVIGMKGLERDGLFEVSRFLLLDPNEDQPPHIAWNSTVYFEPVRKSGRYRLMRSVTGQERLVILNGAIGVGRRR